MAYNLVVVLLLETITDVPGDFDKIIDTKENSLNIGDRCDANIVDSILTTANRGLGLNIRKIDLGIKSQFNNKPNGDSAGEDYEFVVDDSQMSNLFKGSVSDEIEHNEDNGIKTNETLSTAVVAETPPFLVAIFETLSNVTANTCAGTLLTPYWVLTSTSCINVLNDLRKNGTSTEPSIYTVIAEAANPLVDGSAHNVTNIAFHPDYHSAGNTSRSHHTLVMMRINPGVEGAGLEMMGEELALGLEAEAFGWVYVKNDSNPLMKSVSIPVKRVPGPTCALNDTSLGQAICLSTIDSKPTIFEDISKLSWGSPVLQVRRRRARVVAVSHASERALTATPVYPNAEWIQAVITNTSDNIVPLQIKYILV